MKNILDIHNAKKYHPYLRWIKRLELEIYCLRKAKKLRSIIEKSNIDVDN